MGGALFAVFVLLYGLTVFHKLNGWQQTTVLKGANSPVFKAGYALTRNLGCTNCHLVVDSGEYGVAPPLDGEGTKRSKAWLTAFFNDPRSVDHNYYGGTYHNGVLAPNFSGLTPRQKRELVVFLAGLRTLPGSVNYPKPPS